MVEVPAERGYTVEACLLGGPSQCWPQTERGAWWVFDNPEDAEAWLDDEREAGLDWSRWATRGQPTERNMELKNANSNPGKVDAFDWCARLGLMATAIAAASLGFEKSIWIIDFAALGIVLSMLYVWRQLRLKAAGRDYQHGGLLVSCPLSLGAIFGCVYCLLRAVHFVR